MLLAVRCSKDLNIFSLSLVATRRWSHSVSSRCGFDFPFFTNHRYQLVLQMFQIVRINDGLTLTVWVVVVIVVARQRRAVFSVYYFSPLVLPSRVAHQRTEFYLWRSHLLFVHFVRRRRYVLLKQSQKTRHFELISVLIDKRLM